MATIIKPGDNRLVGLTTPLIPFNCLFDLDVGFMTLFADNITETAKKTVKMDRLNWMLADRRRLIWHLYKERTSENPIDYFLDSTEELDADSMYEYIMSGTTDEQRYREIIENSVHTGIYDMLEKATSEITPWIYCDKKVEYDFLMQDDSLPKSLNVVYLHDPNTGFEDLYKCDTIFIRSVADNVIEPIINAFGLYHKTIYFLDYRFNFNEDETNLRDDIWTEYTSIERCNVNIVNAYDINRLRRDL